MKFYEVEERTPQMLEEWLGVWEASVRATHTFLSDAEVERIKGYVPQALGGVGHLVVVAEDGAGRAVGFLGTEGGPYPLLYMKRG